MKNFSGTLQVFEDIEELVTLAGAARKSGRQIQREDLSIVPDAAILCKDGRIQWVGPRNELVIPPSAIRRSLNAKVVLPAFVECHTHSIYAGTRAQEFEWRMQGQTYQEIAAKGGGILSTVKATREASEESLVQLGQKRAQEFLKQGVTTLEIKSGYGLSLESELKILKVARQLTGPRIVTTYLGPHSRSPEFSTTAEYLKEILTQHLPAVAKSGLADRVDIYIEKGFFTAPEAEAYFAAVQKLKLPITAHVEQLSNSGGASASLKFQAQSVDHAVFASDSDIDALTKSETVAVLLPASDLYLRMAYPPARKMIDRGVAVALATDFNPGTSPTQNLSLVGVLARLQMGMSLPEVISAYTVGAAKALGKANDLGSLEAGKYCDFMVLNDSWETLFYSVGHHPVAEVWREGIRQNF
jgi:imidazolonepropionase